LASGAYVYVTAYDSSVTPNRGYVFGFAVGSGGTLTPLNGGVPHDMGIGSKGLGIRPSAIASDPTSTYVYVTDSTNGIVVGYSVSSGVLNLIGDTPAGGQPSAIVSDPAYPYIYVANSLDATVNAYSMSNGALTNLGTYQTGLQPVAIGIDPSTQHFLYTVNFLSNTVSGFELSPTAGTLVNTQFSPYGTDAQPTAVAAIPHKGTGAGVTP
jgi:DNA-binding beta-propeller fold protein YncE